MSEAAPGNIHSPEAALLQKYGVGPGKRASFDKIGIHASSNIPVSSVAEGVIQGTLKRGSPIQFDSGARISNVVEFEERDGKLLVRTATSTYQLRAEALTSKPEAFERDDVALVETAMGSSYRYLPDGTTQRFKKVEGKNYDPQAALVFVPDYAWVKVRANPELMEKLGKDEHAYTQTILTYVHNVRGDQKAYIVNKDGKHVETNKEIEAAEGPVYLALISGDKSDFFIPISHKPQLSFMTFDTRRYRDSKTGEDMRERHLGNKVAKIVLKDGREVHA